MSLPRVQYITHPNENFDDLSWINKLNDGGCKFIQLRIKQNHFEKRHPEKEYESFFLDVLHRMKHYCDKLGIILTVNDKFELGKEVSGVHVGKEDATHKTVRAFIGYNKILGATANSWDDIKTYDHSLLDYMGVGPYKFTTTKDKDKLSPALGKRGYTFINSMQKTHKITTPIYAIGGIELDDIKGIMKTGVYGIAVSGLIYNAKHDTEFITNICKTVENAKV